MREKVKQNAFEGMHDHEVLEYLLFAAIPRKDVNALAHELINAFGSFGGVLDASYEELRKIKGMTDNAALYLTSLPFVFSRYEISKMAGKQKVFTKKMALEYVKALIGNRETEVFLLLCLDVKKQLLKTVPFSLGSRNDVYLQPKDVIASAVRAGAYCVITAHNHPSGDVSPSVDDLVFTRDLAAGLSYLGIHYLDNFIVSSNEKLSFKTDLAPVSLPTASGADKTKETDFTCLFSPLKEEDVEDPGF